MKRLLLLPLLALLALAATAQKQDKGTRSSNGPQYQVFGVAFYNLENLFDTIPNNPLGPRRGVHP